MEKKLELTTLEEFKPVVSLQKKTAGGIPAILNAVKFVMSEAGMLRGTRHYEPISWNGAFDLIASELKALPSPDQAVFYTSEEPVTRRLTPTNCSRGCTEPITYLVAPICVTSRAESR